MLLDNMTGAALGNGAEAGAFFARSHGEAGWADPENCGGASDLASAEVFLSLPAA